MTIHDRVVSIVTSRLQHTVRLTYNTQVKSGRSQRRTNILWQIYSFYDFNAVPAHPSDKGTMPIR